jgi:hypothetical protein
MVYAIDGKAGIDFTKTGSTPLYALGTVVKTNDGEYTYFKHALATAAVAGTLLKLSNAYASVAITTAVSADEPSDLVAPQVDVAIGSTTAQYAWGFSGFGNFNVLVNTGTAAALALTTTTGAGIAGSGGDVIGAALVAANSSGSDALRAAFAPGKLATNA